MSLERIMTSLKFFRMTKLVVDKKCPAVGALLSAKAVEGRLKIGVIWGTETSYSMEGGVIGATTSVGIARSVKMT